MKKVSLLYEHMPVKLKQLVSDLVNRYQRAAEIKRILQYYKTTENKEIENAKSFIRKHGPRMLLEESCLDCFVQKTPIMQDENNHLFYVMHKNKRLYFKRSLKDKQSVAHYYRQLLCEQKPHSPHKYWSSFLGKGMKSIADIGAAEGFLALELADKADHIYLFECEKEWIEALEATFLPYKKKVVMINRFVSDEDTEEMVSLDNYFKDKAVDFIKMDIEGAEMKALHGAKTLLKNGKTKFAVCTYHCPEHAKQMLSLFQNNGYECEFSEGFILYDQIPPYFRKGLIRARPHE